MVLAWSRHLGCSTGVDELITSSSGSSAGDVGVDAFDMASQGGHNGPNPSGYGAQSAGGADNRGVEYRVLRHRAVCRDCRSKLPPRSEAWHDDVAGDVVCDSCYRLAGGPGGAGGGEEPLDLDAQFGAVDPEGTSTASHPPLVVDAALFGVEPVVVEGPHGEPGPANDDVVDLTGVDARDERSDPHVIAPLVAEAPLSSVVEPPITWQGEFFQGPPIDAPGRGVADDRPTGFKELEAVVAKLAVGRPDPDDDVAKALSAAEGRGLVWLTSRRMQGRFDVDHVAVTPNGIWVVRTEPYPSGRVERRDVGDWFTPEPRLFVGDDDRTHVVRQVGNVDESIGRALAGSGAEKIPRYKVICFVDSPPGWLDRPFAFDEVWVTWSRHLVEPMLSSVQYRPEEVALLAEEVDALLPR